IVQRQAIKGQVTDLVGLASDKLEPDHLLASGKSQVFGAEQSNSSMLFDNGFFLKLYRKLEDGVNPDVELNRFLTEHTQFPNVPANCILHSPHARTIPGSRRSLSTPWRSARFTKTCGHHFGARLLF